MTCRGKVKNLKIKSVYLCIFKIYRSCLQVSLYLYCSQLIPLSTSKYVDFCRKVASFTGFFKWTVKNLNPKSVF